MKPRLITKEDLAKVFEGFNARFGFKVEPLHRTSYFDVISKVDTHTFTIGNARLIVRKVESEYQYSIQE